MKFGQTALRATYAGRLAPIGAVVAAFVEPVYVPMPMSAHVAPPLVLSSTTPPSQPPASNAKRCRYEMVSGPAPTFITGEVSDCSSGSNGLVSSSWPLLSGPKNTWSVGDSVRRDHARTFGLFVGSPLAVQFGLADSNVSVAEPATTSS